MNSAFLGPFEVINDILEPSADPLEYMETVRETWDRVQHGGAGLLRLRRPQPTAAFAPQDRVHLRYQDAQRAVSGRGFTPVERGTGGRLTIFDEGAMDITLIAAHPNSREHMLSRYRLFANAIADALRALGVDAQIGELPNEYCPGKYSVHAEKRMKLVGVAQRMSNRAYQMGAIISVQRSERACSALAEAYQIMDIPFDARTYGGITDFLPDVTFEETGKALTNSIRKILM